METADLRDEVRRAARGDERAAGALFDHYYPRLFRYARSRVGSDAQAEDVASETFARVLRGLGRFRWKGAGFEAWLFRIASNLVVDTHRAGGRERPGLEPPDDPAPVDQTPEGLALRKEDIVAVRSMLDKLPEDQREVLVLRFAAELDTNEVGKVMDRKANAVRQLQFRALESLRRMMTLEGEKR